MGKRKVNEKRRARNAILKLEHDIRSYVQEIDITEVNHFFVFNENVIKHMLPNFSPFDKDVVCVWEPIDNSHKILIYINSLCDEPRTVTIYFQQIEFLAFHTFHAFIRRSDLLNETVEIYIKSKLIRKFISDHKARNLTTLSKKLIQISLNKMTRNFNQFISPTNKKYPL